MLLRRGVAEGHLARSVTLEDGLLQLLAPLILITCVSRSRPSGGSPPARCTSSRAPGRAIVFPGLDVGGVLVTGVAATGVGSDPIGIYHAPDVPPPHNYLAFYAGSTGAVDVAHLPVVEDIPCQAPASRSR
jgi:hypothetical protein